MLTVNGEEGQVQITGSTEYGATPQVLVLGNYHSDNYSMTFFYVWPVEHTNLKDAYPGVERWFTNPEDVSFIADGFFRPSKVYQGYYPHIPDGGYQQVETPEALEAIDLGLPSGTLWANMNVGATAPEEPGGYYAWGEIEEKDYYSENTYAYYIDGEFVSLGDDIAGTEYDVAHMMWGGDWVMPTYEQVQELFNYTKSEWILVNLQTPLLVPSVFNDPITGVWGRRFTSKAAGNSNSIFLPAAGYKWHDGHGFWGYHGHYWASTRNPNHYSPDNLYFNEDNTGRYSSYGFERYYGLTIRPVIK